MTRCSFSIQRCKHFKRCHTCSQPTTIEEYRVERTVSEIQTSYSMQFKYLATKTENRKAKQVHNSTNCTSKLSMLYDLHLPLPPTPSLRAVSLALPDHEILCHCCTAIVSPLGLAAVRLSTSARQTPSSPPPRRLGAKRRRAAWGLYIEVEGG